MTTLRSLAGYLLVLYGVSLTLSGCGRDESASEAEAATEHDAPALGVALDEEEARKLGVEVAHIAAGAYQPKLRAGKPRIAEMEGIMLKLLLWCILLILCWPLAIAVLLLYPVVWLLLVPFRLVGVAVEGVLALVRALFLLPAKLLGGDARA